MSQQPDFGNWIRLRRVVSLLLVSLLVLAIGALLPAPWPWFLLPTSIVGLMVGLFLVYVYHQFDDGGGGVQRQLWRLTLDHLGRQAPRDGDPDLTGNALDIGTGNGSLAILLAMENIHLHVTGVDLWNPDWEYSQDDCIGNAGQCGVGERVDFARASADQLPFPDHTFDHVVSHFVFHEVASSEDKREVVREALRVLKPGGFYSFHDMFLDISLYGEAESLLAYVRSVVSGDARLIDLKTLLRLPRALLGKRVLGNCAILCGRK